MGLHNSRCEKKIIRVRSILYACKVRKTHNQFQRIRRYNNNMTLDHKHLTLRRMHGLSVLTCAACCRCFNHRGPEDSRTLRIRACLRLRNISFSPSLILARLTKALFAFHNVDPFLPDCTLYRFYRHGQESPLNKNRKYKK